MLNWTTIAVAAVLIACSGDSKQEAKPTPAAEKKTAAPASDPERTCEELPDHRFEGIQLPPEFAPSLPSGQEELWFAPGMFDEEAPDYFTYTFSLRFDEPQAPSKIETILDDYFYGLMSTVAVGKGRVHDRSSTRVDLRSLDSHLATNCRADYCKNSQTYFVATIETLDEFTSGKPITLHALLELSPSCARVSVGPKVRGTDLEIAERIAHGPQPAWPCLHCKPTL